MNKQLKSPRLIILVMILSLMSVLVAGCGDDKYVQSVKNGTMYMAPNAPVGKAFDPHSLATVCLRSVVV